MTFLPGIVAGSGMPASHTPWDEADRTQVSAERVLPPGRHRLAETEAWLGGRLKAWGVRSSSTGRWLSAAQSQLESDRELVIFVQYDALMLLFTVELWAGGQRVYGIDDWLG